MPRPFPAEFRLRAVALVRAGKTITATAAELGISTGALHNWVRQDQIDRGERPGLTTQESAELTKAKDRPGAVPKLKNYCLVALVQQQAFCTVRNGMWLLSLPESEGPLDVQA